MGPNLQFSGNFSVTFALFLSFRFLPAAYLSVRIADDAQMGFGVIHPVRRIHAGRKLFEESLKFVALLKK
jgi:hypothetical protein